MNLYVKNVELFVYITPNNQKSRENYIKFIGKKHKYEFLILGNFNKILIEIKKLLINCS